MPRTLVPSSLAHALAAAEQPDSARAILGGLLSLEFATLRPGQQQPQLQLPLQLPLPNADFADPADRTGGINGSRLGPYPSPLFLGNDLGTRVRRRGRSSEKFQEFPGEAKRAPWSKPPSRHGPSNSKETQNAQNAQKPQRAS